MSASVSPSSSQHCPRVELRRLIARPEEDSREKNIAQNFTKEFMLLLKHWYYMYVKRWNSSPFIPIWFVRISRRTRERERKKELYKIQFASQIRTKCEANGIWYWSRSCSCNNGSTVISGKTLPSSLSSPSRMVFVIVNFLKFHRV